MNIKSEIIELYQELNELSKDLTSIPRWIHDEILNKIMKYVDDKFNELKKYIDLQLFQMNQELKKANINVDLMKDKNKTEEQNQPTQDTVLSDLKQFLDKDHVKQFNSSKLRASMVFDTESEKKELEKETSSQPMSMRLKSRFYNKIKNKPDLIFLNFAKSGHVFGCYCRKECNRQDFWMEDRDHRLFSFNYKNEGSKSRQLEVFKWKQNCQSFKSFYYKSSGDYLYANMGIVVQSVYDKPYSQIHQWLNNSYDCSPTAFVGHNNLFETMRTIVIQLM